MTGSRLTALVLFAAIASLAIGIGPAPLWDEDEPRFAAIARAMVETGDWIVPTYNDELAVDKPVLMHWCMAAAMTVFGNNEFAARLPSVLATLATALGLLWAGRRWFDEITGAVAALAFVGCLLVGIEGHAATPDAILVALTTWATLLATDSLREGRRVPLGRAIGIGAILGLAVVCKGPVGFVGPLAVVVPWAWWLAMERRCGSPAASASLQHRLVAATIPATLDVVRDLRLFTITAAMLAAAGPWYAAVALRTGGEWTSGFFFVHNVGRFMAPMERHGGSVFFHPLAMLVGFYPWSCFLPLALVVAVRRIWKRTAAVSEVHLLGLLVLWIAVWMTAFSAAATKLPNYVLPAYPAAALLVAALGVEAARRAAAGGWPLPRWIAAGLVSLACGGIATVATVLVAVRFGIPGGEPAALVGLVPIAGAATCWWLARRSPMRALAALAVTGLVFTSLVIGPAASKIAGANTLPAFVRTAQERAGATARLGSCRLPYPNVIYYSNGHVMQFDPRQPEAMAGFLRSGSTAVLLLPEPEYDAIASSLPEGFGIVARTRPIFRTHDVLAVGRVGADHDPRTAARPGAMPGNPSRSISR